VAEVQPGDAARFGFRAIWLDLVRPSLEQLPRVLNNLVN